MQFQSSTATNSPEPSPSPKASIQDILSKEVSNFPGTYNVYIKNLKTNDTFSIRSNNEIPSASIYKLTVMYKTFDAIRKGELSKETKLSNGSTVEEALRLMITISDNDSAILLAERQGWSNINDFIQNEGIRGFNLVADGYPTTTAKATGDLLEKIYREEAVSKEASKEMLKLLLAQEVNDRIPLNLPKKIEVAHKTGELENYRHDAGIIFGNSADYIFVFLTETPNVETAYVNIAQSSKKLFEALESQ